VSKKRYALVGTGFRGMTMFAKPIVKTFPEVAQLVGVCDLNPKRMDNAVEWLGQDVPKFTDFDKMLADAKPDCVIVATRDCTHAEFVIRALRAGKRVYVEKPLCTTARQCRDIIAAARETGNTCLTTHNMRYDQACLSIRSIIQQGRTGQLHYLQFEENLDRSHGADYFRRWHRNRANTGGLQIHKASHQFDLINWWIGSKPATLSAQGSLKFYGKNNSFHGKSCRTCPHAAQCAFYVDYTKIDFYKKFYFDVEQVDGYIRDGCVFDPSIDIEDQLVVHIRYENGVEVNYSLIAYAPYESQRVIIDGTIGRLEYQTALSAGLVPALETISKESQRLIVAHEKILDIDINRADGDHGGADPMLLKDFIGRDWNLPATSQMASLEQAVQAILIGAAINKSLQTGQSVNVQELLEHD
jgi:predicted dehydrogenase